jgi:hypothetical protein
MFLLLDACIIIDAHSLGVWANLVETGQIVVPSIVIRDEAQFYETEQGMIPTPIDLRALLDENRIAEASATAAEMRQVLDHFDRNTQEGLDPGEIEALAIIMQNEDDEMRFCTADRAAVEAIAMLGLSEQGISMECMLDELGLHSTLPLKCTEHRFRQYLENGKVMRVQGKGKPFD